MTETYKIMSGLEDIKSSQFFTRSNMNNIREHSLKLYKEHFHKVNEYLKFGSNSHKNVVIKELFLMGYLHGLLLV